VVAIGFLRRSDSRGSINRSRQANACVKNTRVSLGTLCLLGQSKKAIDHESQIGPCVAAHQVDNCQAWSFQKTNGAVTTVKWNHRGEKSVSPLPATKRIGRLRKTTHRSWVHAQPVGLNAERKVSRHRAEGKIFLLTFPYIGLLRANSCARQLRGFCFPGSSRKPDLDINVRFMPRSTTELARCYGEVSIDA